VASLVPLRPNDHHHATGQESDSADSGPAIVLAAILLVVGLASENERGVVEIKTAILNGLGALGRVESDSHRNNVPPKGATSRIMGVRSGRRRSDLVSAAAQSKSGALFGAVSGKVANIGRTSTATTAIIAPGTMIQPVRSVRTWAT